ncbi:MAG: rod shape-determining protein MreC [Clostridiales bacterium]|nr:rod shape-determining protein MreC [Clostridiales bacterium]
MKIFQSKKGLVILATIVLLISISLTVKPIENPNIFQRGIQTVFLPIQNIVMWPINSVKNSVSFFANMNHYEEENKRLIEENKKLKDEIRQIENAKVENEDLRKLLSLSEKYNTNECLVAEVITKDVGIWVDTLIINKGLTDNITVNSIVLTYDGLVGKVSEVYENSSKVITILDSTNYVGTRIAKTGEYVTASGDINLKSTGMLRLDYITSDVPLAEGDVVETAGIGGIYPEGIFIGTVKDVETDILTTYATVEPGVDFGSLREVLILRK